MFMMPIRVYYEDTDAGGVVYHANYLKFMERARTEWLRQLGFEQDQLKQSFNILFVVRSVQLDYLTPARFNDQLQVSVKLQQMRRTALRLEQSILKDKIICQGEILIVCVGADSFKPVAIPYSIQEAIQHG